jgi:hypothetical protein
LREGERRARRREKGGVEVDEVSMIKVGAKPGEK